MKFTLLKYIIQRFFSVFRVVKTLWSICITLKTESIPIISYFPFPLLPLPLATINLLFIHVDLPILDISHKWSHTTCGLLCLDSFT